MKRLSRIVFLFSLVWVQSANACRPPPDPMRHVSGPSSLKIYDRIYIGEVVSVRLTRYISDLKRTDGDYDEVTLVGGSMPFDFEVFPEEMLKGTTEKPQLESSSGGCSIWEPKLRDRVLVFQKKDGTTRFFVLSDENHLVDESYVSNVRKCLVGKCAQEFSK